MFLKSFEYFRGVTILFIVAGHCYELGNWKIDHVFEKFIANLISGGSSLFVFISGFLFHFVFYENFKYSQFIRKKIKNVLVPYLALSILPIIYFVFIKNGGQHVDYMQLARDEWLLSILFYVFGGSTLQAYWYVPFIMIVFFLSPVFISFIESRRKTQIFVAVSLLILSLLSHRPEGNINVFQSVLYFTPFYLIGILSSINKDYIYSRLPKFEWILLSGVFALSLLQAIFYDHYGNFHKNIFEFSSLDILLVQKLLLCFFFMTFLRRFENTKCLIMSFLATISFPVFFLHPLIIEVLSKFIATVNLYHGNVGGPHLWFLSSLIVLTLSIFLAVIVKLSIPKYSKQIVGW